MASSVVPFHFRSPFKIDDSRKPHNSKLSNPLKPFGNAIRLCGFLGFPLKLADRHLIPFGSRWCMRYFPLFFFYSAFTFMQLIFCTSFLLGGGELSILVYKFQLLGFTTIDNLAIIGIFAPHGFALLRQNFSLLHLAPQWNCLNAFFGKILSQGNLRKNRRIFFFIFWVWIQLAPRWCKLVLQTTPNNHNIGLVVIWAGNGFKYCPYLHFIQWCPILTMVYTQNHQHDYCNFPDTLSVEPLLDFCPHQLLPITFQEGHKLVQPKDSGLINSIWTNTFNHTSQWWNGDCWCIISSGHQFWRYHHLGSGPLSHDGNFWFLFWFHTLWILG